MGDAVKRLRSLIAIAAILVGCAALASASPQISTIGLQRVMGTSFPGGSGLVTVVSGVPGLFAGTSCSGQFPRSLSAAGVATCAKVSLSADVTGTIATASLYGGTAPSTSSGFGSGVAGVLEAGSSDFGWRVTVGTGGDTGGTVTMGGTYTVAPHCVCNNETTGVACKIAASTTVQTITATMLAAATITGVCR